MNQDCRLFCPLAEMCFKQHEALAVAQDSAERLREKAAGQLEELERHFIPQDNEVAFEELALRLISEGIQIGTDRDSAINESLENLAVQRKMRQDTLEKIAAAALEKARLDRQNTDSTEALHRSHYAISLLGEARFVCDGPRLSITGRMLLSRAAVLDWFGLTPVHFFEARKTTLFRKYARCIQPKAKAAAEQYKNMHVKAA